MNPSCFWRTLWILLGAFAMSCAPDRTTEQFNTARRKEQWNRIQSVAGTYRGEVDLTFGAGRAGFALLLEPSNEVVGTEQRATVRGTVRVETTTPVKVGFSQGAYDTESNDLNLRIPLELTETSRDALLIRGTIVTNQGEPTFQGTLSFETHDSDWPTVSLVKTQNPIPDPGSQLRSPDPQEDEEHGTGTAYISDGEPPLPAEFSISERKVTNQQMLFSLFSHTKLVDVLLWLGKDRSVGFSLAGEFDGLHQSLRADGRNGWAGSMSRLNCQPATDSEGIQARLWDCLFRNQTAQFSIKLGRIPFSR